MYLFLFLSVFALSPLAFLSLLPSLLSTFYSFLLSVLTLAVSLLTLFSIPFLSLFHSLSTLIFFLSLYAFFSLLSRFILATCCTSCLASSLPHAVRGRLVVACLLRFYKKLIRHTCFLLPERRKKDGAMVGIIGFGLSHALLCIVGCRCLILSLSRLRFVTVKGFENGENREKKSRLLQCQMR